ncbi:hypothetical protein M33023_00240 [Candidatus Phytoplasma asteris]|uniref:Uncharacterized protein n=2 Tax=Candidatus Phytoplasma asteris TaxID=85620 RepID=A0ABZ2YGL6_9MOLU
MFLGLFFPKRKIRNLEIKLTKKEHQEHLLFEKLDQLIIAKEKLLSKLEQQKHKVAIWQSKKERKRLLKFQKNHTPIGKD